MISPKAASDRQPSHFPGPSIWPFGFALGVAVALVGLIIGSWPVAASARSSRSSSAPSGSARPPARCGPSPSRSRRDGRRGRGGGRRRPDEHHYTRNVFLAGATLGIGAAIGAVVTLPALGFAGHPGVRRPGVDPVDLGPLYGYPEGQWMVTKFNSEARRARGRRSPHRLHPQQRPDGRRPAERHDPLEPLRPPRVPRAADRAQAEHGGDRDRGRHDRARRPPTPSGLRLPVPRRRVRPRGQPRRRPAGPRARPLRVLDRGRQPRRSASSSASPR